MLNTTNYGKGKKEIIIDGVKYDSLTHASRAIGCSFATMSKTYNSLKNKRLKEHNITLQIKKVLVMEIPNVCE